MKGFSQVDHSLHPKTRVLICSPLRQVTQLLLYVLDFHGKSYDFYSETGANVESGSDFLIAETSDLQEMGVFKPNIVLISGETTAADFPSSLQHISSGGVLIFPKHLEDVIESTDNYFRKIPFESLPFRKEGADHVLLTEIGDIPLPLSDAALIENLAGINQLCRQFGVMDEDFYEALIEFR